MNGILITYQYFVPQLGDKIVNIKRLNNKNVTREKNIRNN